MAKNRNNMSRQAVYKLCQKSKHRFNTNYELYIKKLTRLQRGKLKLICDRLNVQPHQLREREFRMITTNKQTVKLFKRACKHRELYDSFTLVLKQSTR